MAARSLHRKKDGFPGSAFNGPYGGPGPQMGDAHTFWGGKGDNSVQMHQTAPVSSVFVKNRDKAGRLICVPDLNAANLPVNTWILPVKRREKTISEIFLAIFDKNAFHARLRLTIRSVYNSMSLKGAWEPHSPNHGCMAGPGTAGPAADSEKEEGRK